MASNENRPRVRAQDFRHVREGDTVTRLLAGCITMRLGVDRVDERYIWCGYPHGWKFSRCTGFEVDEELGLPAGQAASWLLDDRP